MSTPLVAPVAVSSSQPRPLRVLIPLIVVAALLILGVVAYAIFKLSARFRKIRNDEHSENLKQELESGAGHSSVTCCGTVQDSKELKFRPPPISFETEVEEISKHYTRLSYDMFTPSPSMTISPARRSSSIFLTRSDSLPLPSRALLYPSSPRRASIPVMWSNPRSSVKWMDETYLGPQGKTRYLSHRPATSPSQQTKKVVAPEFLRRSITPML